MMLLKKEGLLVDVEVALAADEAPSDDNELDDAIIDATIPITMNKTKPTINPIPINMIKLRISSIYGSIV